MSKKNTNLRVTASQRDSLYAFGRFIASLIILLLLAVADLNAEESVPTVVYLLVGGLNGVDAYKLFKEIK